METSRTRLRFMTAGDATAVHQIYTLPDVKKYLGGWETLAETERFIAGQLMRKARGRHWPMVICDTATELIIGVCNISRSPLEEPHEIEISIGLAGACRGLGIPKEVVPALVNWACDTNGARHVVGLVKPDNFPSLAMLRTLGAEHIADRIELTDGKLIEHIFAIYPDKSVAG
jgi:RimJ/RimL family protein N-acetyltransferase